MAAEVKEVVVRGHAGSSGGLGKERGHELFGGRARREEAGRAGRLFGRGKPGAIELAVRRQREGVHRDHTRASHGRGQTPAQVPQKLAFLEKRVLRRHGISDEIRSFGSRLREHYGFADRRVLRQHRGHLAQLDARAANLDLIVHSPDELEIAVGALASQVSRAIDAAAGTGTEWITEEALARQILPMEIAARDAGPADPDLARASLRNQASFGIDEVDVQIGKGPANESRLGLRVRLLERAIGRVNRRLGDAVHVDEARREIAEAVEPGPHRLRGRRSAGSDPRAPARRPEERRPRASGP